jgi:hypothetical protein
MNAIDVRFDIEHHTNAYTGKGALTTVEVDRLVRLAATPDSNSTVPDDYLVWAPSTALTLTTLRVPSTRTGYVYRVSTAGTTGLAEPSVWPTTLGQTIGDGTVTWTVDAAAPWLGVWDVYAASAVGCRWRAAKLADQFNVALGAGKSFNRRETPEFWIALAEKFEQESGSGSVGVLTLRTESFYA